LGFILAVLALILDVVVEASSSHPRRVSSTLNRQWSVRESRARQIDTVGQGSVRLPLLLEGAANKQKGVE